MPAEVTATEEVASVEEAAPVEAASVESAPVEAAPEAAPAATEVVSQAPAVRPSLTTNSYAQRAATKATATKSRQLPVAKASKFSVPDPDKKDENTGGGCSGTASNFGLSAPVVTSTTVNGVASTQFAWTVTYTGTDGCESEALSHITLTPCLAANGGDYTEAAGSSYKWDFERLVGVGDVLTLTFPGTVAATGTVGTELKKSDEAPHTPSVAGPDCTTGGDCEEYTLTTTSSPSAGGSIAVTGAAAPYTNGESVTLTPTASQGYAFSSWSGDGSGTETRSVSFTGTDCTREVTANFSPISQGDCPSGYSLTTTSSPTAGGSIAVTGDSAPYTNGESVTLTATENSGYTFSNWSGDGTGTTTRSVSFTGADCALEVTANFTPVNNDCRTWTVTVVSNGTVTSPNELLDKTESYTTNPNGTVVTAQAPANHSPANQQATVSGLSNSVCSTTVTLNFDENERDCNGDFNENNNGLNGDCTTPPVLDCNGDTDATNNGPNGDCTTPPVLDCNGDTNPANNGPNGDCTIPPVPDCSGDFDPTNNGPNGDCTIPPVPDCSGDFDPTNNGPNGDCVEPVTDVCPNIDGDQTEVPEDMVLNPVTGQCDEDEVKGIIIDKDPQPSKPEPEPRVDPHEVAPAVLPSNVQAGVLPFTGSDLVPFVVIAGLLMAVGAGLTLRRPASSKK